MSSEPLKPQFFVTRQNGNMVPLVAMDELPSTVSIRNVSRSLSPYDVSGMTGIGTFEARHMQHVVEPRAMTPLFDRSTPISMSGQLSSPFMASKYAGLEHPSQPRFTNGYPAPVKAFGITEQAPSSTPIRQPQARPPTPTLPTASTNIRVDRHAHHVTLPPWQPSPAALGLQAAPGIKEYCSYWLRHGECDYAQQGCLYKHEMPLDKSTLEKLGLRDIPRWYREKHGLGSYLAATSSATAGSDVEGKNRKEEILTSNNWRSGKGKDRRASLTARINNLKLTVAGGGSAASPADPTTRPRRTSVSPPCPPRGRQSQLHTAKAIHMRMPAEKPQVRVMETEREKQMKKTLAALDAYEEQERQRKARFETQVKREEYVAAVQKRDSSGTTTPTDEIFDKGDGVAGAGVVTPPTSNGSSDDDAVPTDLLTAPAAQIHTQPAANGRAAAAGRPRKKSGRDGVQSRRRVAPPSESGSGESTMAMSKVGGEDLLGGYDHDD